MYCKNCGGEIPDNARFCPYCGGRLFIGGGLSGADAAEVFDGMYGNGITKLNIPDERKSPGVAAALGFFLGWVFLGPLGYGYLGQWNWFWLTFIIEIFAIPLTVGLAYIVLPIVFAIHQYQMAKDINRAIDLLEARALNEKKEEDTIT